MLKLEQFKTHVEANDILAQRNLVVDFEPRLPGNILDKITLKGFQISLLD